MTKEIEKARQLVDQQYNDGRYAIRLCSDILLNLAVSPDQNQKGLLEFYKRALKLIGPSIKFIKDGQAARWKKAPKDLSGLLAAWFERGAPQKGSYSLGLESSEYKDGVSDCAFMFSWVLSAGYVRLILPAEKAFDDPAAFYQLVTDMAPLVKFSSGTAGISANLHIDCNSTDEEGTIAFISKHYPGIDLGKPLYWSDLVTDGLKTVNWLTLLGPDMLAQTVKSYGSKSAFMKALGTDSTMIPLPNGMLLKAGDMPILSDADKPAGLAPYRAVARSLHHLKIPADILRGYDGIGGTENTRRWLNRFNE